MSRHERNIEDLFRILFEQFTVNPSPGLWKKIQAKIAWKQFLSFSLHSFNVYFLAAGLTLAGAAAYFLLPADGAAEKRGSGEMISVNHVAPPPEPAKDPVIVRDPPSKDASIHKRAAGSTKLNESPAEPVSRTKPVQPEASRQAVQRQETTPKPAKTETSEDASSQPASSETRTITAPEAIKVTVGFEANPARGCSPLAVNFHNLSENADGFNWTFGDGGNSTEPNPSYVFDEPGDFLVTLRTTGKDGKEYSRQQTIHVFETPKALFEFEEDIDLSKKQPVYFYNYSRGADHCEWDFGDNQTSVLFEPIHFYEKAGSYHVKLKVWTDHQCYDSLVIFNAFTTQEQNIKVPNAFTPNLNGPTGGYYDINDYENMVFHPVINGELTDYSLKIFNRKGVLLFESNDVSIGWDGYYNEQLVKQDVYIWKIRGQFNNGKTFVESGDVTLIKQY